MGIEILSFTIKDVFDDVEYLSSLGKSQTANVRRDADIGVAQAGRDAGIRVITKILKGNSWKLIILMLKFYRNQNAKGRRWMLNIQRIQRWKIVSVFINYNKLPLTKKLTQQKLKLP
jgi:uncharacterized membrane protein YqiK